jgi:fructosamine-3-kinase
VNPALWEKLSARLGSRVTRTQAAPGGDINETFLAVLADGQRVFVKTHASPPAGMYACEAHGLGWLAEAGAVRVPRVLLSCDADEHGPGCLVLEAIEQAKRSAGFDEALGSGLAQLHRAGASQIGLDHDNYIALLPQDNRAAASWGRFYAEQRIAPQVALAQRKGHLGSALLRRLARFIDRLDDLVGAEEPPARLHGDLWSGNLLSDEHGAPCLIDPAVYGGHREVDLAMMRLFGGFSERVFAAYDAAFPLAAGHRERVPLYQLYPVLVHVNLFGGQYVRQVEQIISRWV